MRSSARALQVKAAAAALVAAASLAAFARCLDNGFVGWDDDAYLVHNPFFRGLTWAHWRWMLATTREGLYQPLTWASFAVDHALWGLEPAGYHLTNLLLHAAAAVLLVAVLRELLGAGGVAERAAWPAAAAGALFWAVHPLRVESVVWATERKDVLGGVLWLGALLAYLRRRPTWSAALFALSLGAKVSGAALPALLVLLDFYPLRRLPADRRSLRARYRSVWLEKIPFAVLAMAATAAGGWALRREGLVRGLAQRNLAWRAGQAAYGLFFYAAKTAWPSGLLPYYPPAPWFGRWGPAVGLLAAAVLCAALAWLARRRWPAATACAAAYVLLAVPALGLVQTATVWRACDRYSYLPSLAFSALVAAAAARWGGRRVAAASLAGVLAALGAASWRQTALWRDSLTLWSADVAGEPSAALGWRNLAVAELEAGRAGAAVDQARRAVSASPEWAPGYEALGAALERAGRRAESEAAYRAGLEREPASGELNERLGALLADGAPERLPEAVSRLRAAAGSGATGARVLLAGALAKRGALAEARREYEEAIRRDPGDGAAHVDLGLLLQQRGERAAARAEYRAALADPGVRPQAHLDWGNLSLEEGRLDDAARHYAEAVRLAGLPAAHVNWGNALARRGRYAEAAAHYRLALARDPSSTPARANLAGALRLLGR